MSRCRVSRVSSRVLVRRAIDLLVPWLAAMVPLAPNAATASLAAARTSIAPAETPAGPRTRVQRATDHEPARTACRRRYTGTACDDGGHSSVRAAHTTLSSPLAHPPPKPYASR